MEVDSWYVCLRQGCQVCPEKNVARKYIRHCSAGKIHDGRHLSKVKQMIHITFNRIKADSSTTVLKVVQNIFLYTIYMPIN